MRAKLLLSMGIGLIALFSGQAAWAEDQGQVCVSAGGGSYQDALREAIFKPFEKATGIKVVEAVEQPLAKIRTMVSTGSPECDVAQLGPGQYFALSKEGLLEKIDYTSVDKKTFADFPEDAVTPYGVGTFVYDKVIGFNTKRYTRDNGPKSWADVWDVKKFPGPRILDAGNNLFPPIEYALLADGVSPDKLYPLDLKRAYAALTRIKPDVAKWSTTAAMQLESLISGEAVIGPATLGRLQEAKEHGAPVDYVVNQALMQHDYWTILKGAKNSKNAAKFIEFASRPESQAGVIKYQVLGPLNRRAFELIPPERAKLLPTYPENLAHAIKLNPAWWAETDASGKTNLEKNNAMWNAWILQ
ncbi:ABC transporter substrate-binding protein [Bradyrhizobium sp. ORS 86]|uniref:ABC transporter substrate-binding protein n=1 Tax=Bradyrhizobium sp. ORS 86 TaxID=1685970 RepID=UPI00388EDF53